MPFTFSHPAAVLPLLRHGRGRGRMIGSALVFGAMAPDTPYFAGAFAWGDLAHRWWAVPTLDVAITLALAAVWQLVLRAPLIGLLPVRWAGAAERLTGPSDRRIRWSRAPWFALSAALGAATHVFWDAFTHPGRLGTRVFPVLTTARILGEPLYAALQYGTSAIALVLLGWHAVRELRRAAADGGRPVRVATAAVRRRVLWLTLAAAVLGAAYRFAGWGQPGMPLLSLIPVVAFGAVAGAGGALVLYALAAPRRG
ncbi:DUF4184 family protein [Streptomyces kaniharaensis]|uniref:DUF4184 family protein n=1 Tax=Streptomyces kaniharaensis TaxID=212423 RepID=UPI0018A829CE|nr:DUF4184 family protein [Streptomyces kaniharaensis]